jgi:hypothetical protein
MSSFKDARIDVRQNKLSRLSQRPALSIVEVSGLEPRFSYNISITPAAPCPVPTHIVTIPYFC